MCGPVLFEAETSAALDLESQSYQQVYNLQATNLVTGLSYNCSTFSAQNVCVQGGTRYLQGGNNFHDTAGYIIAAYQINQHVNIGGFIDQSQTHEDGGAITRDADPMFGIFVDYLQHKDGTGFAAHFSAAFAQSDLVLTRPIFDSSEAGFGSADLNSDAFSAIFSYGFGSKTDWMLSPYVGIRHMVIEREGYTEAATIAEPLTFSPLADEATTIMAGTKFSMCLSPTFTLSMALGLEHDIDRSTDLNIATYSLGTVGADFGIGADDTRVTASLMGEFTIAQAQSLVLSTTYRQEALGDGATMTGQAAYRIGF